jgi:predicted RNA-binding protein with TRAM domain
MKAAKSMTLLPITVDNIEWWKNYGLIRRPTLSIHPLSTENALTYFQIAEDPEFKSFLELARDPANFYGRVFAVLGQYGSGKTSLLNYVQAAAYSNEILCITIKGPPQLANELEFWLYNEILNRLRSKVVVTDHISNLKPSADAILEIRDILLKEKYSGILIFIDELHHFPEPKALFDFLKSKQGFLEDFVSSPFEKVGIFIAGLPEWATHLKQPGYQGIFDQRISMPLWHKAEDAYELVHKRFEAAASETGFLFPFSKYDSFEKILSIGRSESPKGTPRFIVENTLKVLESPKLAPGSKQITGDMIPRLVSIPSQEGVQGAIALLDKEYHAIHVALNRISRKPPDEREKLHVILIALSLRGPLGQRLNFVTNVRPHKLDRRLTLGTRFKEVREISDALDELTSSHLLKSSELVPADLTGLPPDRYVDLVKDEMKKSRTPVRKYELRNDFLVYQERVEEMYQMKIDEYLPLLFASTPAIVTATIRIPDDKIAGSLKTAHDYLHEAEAKRHVDVCLGRHALLMDKVRTQSVDTLSSLHAMEDVLIHITLAFYIERTKAPDRLLGDLASEVRDAFNQLDLEEYLDQLLTLIQQIKTAYASGGMDDDSWNQLHERFRAIVIPYVDAFRQFAVDGPAVFEEKVTRRLLKQSQEAMTAEFHTLEKQIKSLEVPAVDPEETSHFLQDIADRFSLGVPAGEWVSSLLDTLHPLLADNSLHNSVNLRLHQPPQHREVYRKCSLYLAGDTVENLLVAIGRRHLDKTIRTHFNTADKLQMGTMLSKIFGTFDVELVKKVTAYGRFDRSDSLTDVEKNLKLITSEKRQDVKDFATALCVRNFHDHDSLSWGSREIVDLEGFSQIHDSISAGIIRFYLLFYLKECFLPPVKFKNIELLEAPEPEKRRKVRVDGVLWGWVDEPLVRKVWAWLETGANSERSFDEFQNPLPEITMFEFIRALGFLVKKGYVSMNFSVKGWDCKFTENASQLRSAERARLGEQLINMMSAVPREQPSANKENAGGQNEVEVGNDYEVVITAMGRRGDGITRVGGLVVFVPGAKAGDHVKIRIKSLWPTFAVGDLID